MQLAIPSAPRPVRLTQLPGAVRRVTWVGLLCLSAVVLVTLAAVAAGRWLSDDARFAGDAVVVTGSVVKVDRPSRGAIEGSSVPVAVIYSFGGSQRAATVDVEAALAEPLGRGAPVELLVLAAQPERPRHRGTTEARAGRNSLVLPVAVAGLMVAVLVLLREVRRAVRREVEPLRLGRLVWLTIEGPWPQGGSELAVPAHYFRDDVKHAVTARVRQGPSPVRQGEKVLAAVAPREPTWVRVVDEAVARGLGWYR
jgi:hypothetical protein